MDKKRILFAIIFTLICIGLGYLLYRVFFYKAPTAKVPTTGKPTTGVFPQAGEGAGQVQITGDPTLPTAGGRVVQTTGAEKITPTAQPIVQNPINTAIISAGKDTLGSAKFYNNTDGKFYRLMKDGTIKELSNQVFYNVQKATWSPTADEAIIEYPDGSNVYYNFADKKQVSLPKHWEEFSFAPQGDKIAAKSIGLAVENQWLVTADPNGKNISLIEPMGENANKVAVSWSPNQQVVALSRTGEALGDDREEVLLVGLHGENFKSTIVEGRGFKSEWSPEGKKLLYSVYSARSDFKPEIWVVDAQTDSIGANRKMIGLNTWADKCAFSDERFVYCAVPQTMDTGAAFAPALADTTPDKIYRVDLQTGLKNEITMDANHTVQNMFIGDNGQILYFQDKNQDGLFKVKI